MPLLLQFVFLMYLLQNKTILKLKQVVRSLQATIVAICVKFIELL